MSLVWTEEMIRDELRRLDKKIGLGLKAASLQIELRNYRSCLGKFHKARREEDCYFSFSKYFFEDTVFPDDEKLDTVRHEFSHYYDAIIFGGKGHAATWKYCCSQTGAIPSRSSSNDRVRYLRKKEAQETELGDQAAHFTPGKLLLHPKYELGVIQTVCGEPPNQYLEVEFGQGVKKISLRWALENCDIE